MIVGGWTRRLRPLPGELLTSCLARNAHAHGCAPYRFMNMFWEGDPVWSRDFDRDPAGLSRAGRRPHIPDWLDDVAARLGVVRAEIEAATLAGWRVPLAGTAPALFGDTPLMLAAGVLHRTRVRHALQYCPDCLDGTVPHFLKAWRLGFVVTCERHGAGLRDACPHCDAPIVPHRSMTTRMTDCHACGRSLVDHAGLQKAATPAVPERVAAVQRSLLALLEGDEPGSACEPWNADEAFGTLRTLLSASSARPVRGRLDAALGLSAAPASAGRLRFAHLRLDRRIAWLDTIAAWTANWPQSFREGANAAGLTRLSFARARLPAALAMEVARLPVGVARDRSWVPVLDEPVLRRLRRIDRPAYSRVRAARILEACSEPQ